MDERRGFVVRRVRGEGCVDVSVSSTSKDRFSAGEKQNILGLGKKLMRIVAHTDAGLSCRTSIFVIF